MRKNKKTFYDWCIENDEQRYLDLWDYERNKKSPTDYSYGSNENVYFKCPRGLHDDTLKCINKITSPNRNVRENFCCKCNSFEQWCIDNGRNDLIESWDYELNDKMPSEVGYCSNESFYFKCTRGLHNSHKHVLSTIVAGCNKVKCNECNSIAQFGIDNICKDFIEKYWSNKNKYSPYDVPINSKKKILLNCQICGQEYDIRADHFTRGVRHKGCSLLNRKSNLQRNVECYISEMYPEYTLLHEDDCTLVPKSPINGHNLYFDNEIKELKLIIEVHGIQHYKTCSWYKQEAERRGCSEEDVFNLRKYYDEYKMDEALKNGYLYLVIPYWVEENQFYKNMIDDEINHIKEGLQYI